MARNMRLYRESDEQEDSSFSTKMTEEYLPEFGEILNACVVYDHTGKAISYVSIDKEGYRAIWLEQ
jgi:hypothetical protein